MSRHEGVSCDSCSKGNFRGKRFKCLICYDYDLCSTCYENGATTTRHTSDHPMQCILTRADFELYYGGENFTADQPQAFTCPYCSKIGFTEALLQEHVTSDHTDASTEVVCPVCAALPGGDPNHVTDDFAAHLTLEHRAPRDIDESGSGRQVRRMFHPGRGVGGPRPPRPRTGAMNYSSSNSGSIGPSSSSVSSASSFRESMDPIAELLSQLSGVRRAAQQAQPPVQSQLQLLQQQLQLERQQVQQTRERLERLPQRRQAAANSNQTPSTPANQEKSNSSNSQFLLSRANEPALSDSDQEELEVERADRSLFVQDLIVSSLGSISIRGGDPSHKRQEIIKEFCSLQESQEGAFGGGETLHNSVPESTSILETNEDIQVISLETEDDKDS